MLSKSLVSTAVLLAATLVPATVLAQRAPYGNPLTLEQAKKVMGAAEGEARKLTAPLGVAIAVYDSGCNLVLLQRLDNTNLGGTQIAQDKAYAACAFRFSTKAPQDALAKGGEGLRLLQLARMVAVEGGLVIVADGRTVGAIGVSGATSEQDGQIAKAGADALK